MLNSLSFDSQRITHRLGLYFAIVFLVNFIFKLNYLDFSSFWYDEIISIKSASLDYGLIKHVSEWDNNPPFYFYCLSVWTKLFNDSEFTARLLSVIFSSLAAGVLFLIANKFLNKTTAIISSILFLSSNILFYYSHEARAYSLVLLLSLVSSYLYFNFKDNQSFKTIILLGLINFLLIYTHYISGLVLFFQVVMGLFFFNKKQKIRFSYSLLIVVLLTLLRFTKKQFLLIVNFNSPKSTFWLKKSDGAYLQEVISTFLFNKYAALVFLLIILMVIVFIMMKKTEFRFYILYAICLGLGSIIVLFFMGKMASIFLDRYLIFALPFLFILIGFGLSFVKKSIIPISVVVLFFVFCAFKMDYKTNKGMDYKNAMNFVKSVKQKNDLIIVKTKDVEPLFCYYYESGFFRNKELPPNKTIIFCSAWQDLSLDPKEYSRIIMLDSFEDLNPNEKEFSLKLTEIKKMYYKTNAYKGVKISFYR